MKNCSVASLLIVASTWSSVVGFAPSATFVPRLATPLSMSDTGNVEQIEFKIFPDGRVEETVRGIKGNNCHKVTEKINESLGEVIASSPTEDMYEQELFVDQTITQTQGENWDGGSTW